MCKLRFIGLDVHKDTLVVAVAEEGQGEAVALGTYPHDVAKLIKRLTKLEADVSQLRVCYEAGPTGFGLSRWLNQAGIKCIVIAPSLVPQQAGARVKTDRRDARRLAHFLRSGDLTEVWVPDEQTEALRDLERSRDDAKNAERVARHQFDKFLLRNERVFREGRSWTMRHNYRHRPTLSAAVRERQQGVSKEVTDIAWKAQQRLCKRLTCLLEQNKARNKAIAAVARELAGFVWAVGQVKQLLAS